MTPTLSSLLWFVAVLAAIPAVLWLLRQSPLGRLHGLRPAGGECPVRTLSSHALSPSQRVVTVEVGNGSARRWLVLGVTPAGITTLHQLEPGGQGQLVPTPKAAAPVGVTPPRVEPPTLHHVLVPGEVAAASGTAAQPFAALLARLRRRPSGPVSPTAFADTCPSVLPELDRRG
jgi:flagellar protein FliO/FliZ